MALVPDRVGLGWRGELSASILCRLEALDVVEVIAEDWLHASRSEAEALRTLGASCPVMLHGVSLGLASSAPVEAKRLDRMARLVERVQPLAWSEHLAFVRADGVEIGHLTAPPRTRAVIEGTAANLSRARAAVGALPAVENIATLIEPPASELDEAQWTRAIVAESGAPMLIDLHNLYANAVNFGRAQEPSLPRRRESRTILDAHALLDAMPLDRVTMVHLSGGCWISSPAGRRYLLDDHVHGVPDAVYALLERLAFKAPQPLTVIIERDGNYPVFDVLLGEVGRARAAVCAGRAARASLERRAA
jgi:uncharacterized protein (UPF0276 family)